MFNINWDDILAKKDLIGRFLEYTMSGKTFKGPVSKIQRTGDIVKIDMEWVAERKVDGWDYAEKKNLVSVQVDLSNPYENETGTIQFGIWGLGIAKLLPKDSEILEPSWIEGLKIKA